MRRDIDTIDLIIYISFLRNHSWDLTEPVDLADESWLDQGCGYDVADYTR